MLFARNAHMKKERRKFAIILRGGAGEALLSVWHEAALAWHARPVMYER